MSLTGLWSRSPKTGETTVKIAKGTALRMLAEPSFGFGWLLTMVMDDQCRIRVD